ncbi:MAG: hypothetical protein Q6353_010480 [Candidatus Sigynarchaeum springense]
MSFFLTDTCFWTHVKDVYDFLQLDLRMTLNKFRWGTTRAILDEIKARNLSDFVHVEQGYLVPVSDAELASTRHKLPMIEGLDFEDQTLIVAALREHAVILTDDGALFLECQASGLEAMNLPHFCLRLARDGILDKNMAYRMLEHWEETGRFAARFIKKWKKELQAIGGLKE